ncbi:DUF3179 domain-containing protein [Ekhidna sp.]
MKNIINYLIVIALLTASCKDDDAGANVGGPWSIPQNEVLDGGPGKDGIPALVDPEMVTVGGSNLDYLNDDDLVIGIKRGDDIRAYAHPILDWHEIINDQIGDDFVAITYCPLTGTAIGWDRHVNGELTTFGVSGLLYQSNLIPYDRSTDSNYSQMLTIGVNGDQIDNRPSTHHLVETTWATWKRWYPETKITSSRTGHNRSYGFYPYGDYMNTENLIFPISNPDGRLHAKERVLGVVGQNESVIAFQFDSFTENAVIDTEIDGERLIIIGSQNENWMLAFKPATIDGQQPIYSISDQGAILFTDDFGNQYDGFGTIVEGPNVGMQLETYESFIGFWFAWATFYPQVQIFE